MGQKTKNHGVRDLNPRPFASETKALPLRQPRLLLSRINTIFIVFVHRGSSFDSACVPSTLPVRRPRQGHQTDLAAYASKYECKPSGMPRKRGDRCASVCECVHCGTRDAPGVHIARLTTINKRSMINSLKILLPEDMGNTQLWRLKQVD